MATALSGTHWVNMCPYVEPGAQAQCKSIFSALTPSEPSMRNVALGYVAIDGDRALVGVTGTMCAPGQSCSTNSDPATIFSTNHRPFSALFTEQLKASASNSSAYSLAPCIEVDGKWYVDESG
jgi:hypothetical protein